MMYVSQIIIPYTLNSAEDQLYSNKDVKKKKEEWRRLEQARFEREAGVGRVLSELLGLCDWRQW